MKLNQGKQKCGGALQGVCVVDLSRVLAGPLCSMILADHGADVIKVEPPQGDDTRRWGPPFASGRNEERGDASYFIGLNRNKRALALDLSRTEGRDVLLNLLEVADVLIDNFKPGTMEGWGLDYATHLAQRYPRLVHCSISGFGSGGPLGGLPGYDAVLQAMSGLMSINGDVATGPLRIGTPIVDTATALYSTIAILMAVQERTRSGLGQHIDMALYDCGMSLLHPHAANFFLDGKTPAPQGNQHPNVVPCDKFTTRDGEVFLVVGNEGQFRKLAEMLSMPELTTDARFATNAARAENRQALTELLARRFALEEALTISVALLEAGVPIGPVMSLDAALNAPHTSARQMVVQDGTYQGLGTPIKFSRTPASLRRVPPAFGADNAELLAEREYDPGQIARLKESGVVPSELPGRSKGCAQASTESWSRVLDSDDLPEGEVWPVALGGHDICLYRVDGMAYATEDRCSHGSAKLSDGYIMGGEIECPFHQGRFDIRTGQPTLRPCVTAIATYPVEERDGGLWVLIKNTVVGTAVPVGE